MNKCILKYAIGWRDLDFILHETNKVGFVHRHPKTWKKKNNWGYIKHVIDLFNIIIVQNSEQCLIKSECDRCSSTYTFYRNSRRIIS